jgi:hypothetical protein
MFSPTRFVFLAGVFVFLTAVPVQGTEEFANPPRPFPVVMGEQIAANLVDLIFLFDRVASDPPPREPRITANGFHKLRLHSTTIIWSTDKAGSTEPNWCADCRTWRW